MNQSPPSPSPENPRPRKRTSLIVNALSNWGGLGAHLLVGLFLTPIIIGHLGKTGYGIWTLVYSFAGYYGLLNFGIRSAIMRYVARYSEQQDTDALNRTISTAGAFFLATGIAVVILSWAIAPGLAAFFHVSAGHEDSFVLLVRLLGIITALDFITSLLTSILSAFEKYVVINSVNASAYIGRAVAITVALSSGAGLPALGWATIGMNGAMLIAYAIICRTTLPQVVFSVRAASGEMLKTLAGYGSATFIMILVNMMRTKFDSLVIGRWISVEAVAVYGVAALVVRYMFNVINTAVGVVTPRFAKLDGAGNKEELTTLFSRAMFVSALLAFGGGAEIMILGSRFITLWVGEGFETSVPVLWILTGAFTAGLAQNAGYGLMLARNRHHKFARISIVETASNVILSIILAPRLGIVGVALGTAIPMLFVKVFVQPWYVARVAEMPIKTYLAPILLPATVGTTLTALVFAGNLPLFPREGGFLSLLPAALGIGVIYLLAIWIPGRFFPALPAGVFPVSRPRKTVSPDLNPAIEGGE